MTNGYVGIKVPKNHHLAMANQYAYEHRLIAEQKLGRRLRPGEEVHHINGDITDNRPENLEVLSSRHKHKTAHRKEGSRLRKPGESNPVISCPCGCGQRFRKYDSSGRPRRYAIGGHWRRYATQQTAR
jgi:hypothetical protein